ncbi:3-methylornithyl-N6-L-lysine dehydrogenase PylD [Deltaproteobacteria bacterium Smac51]|nr:3-methylornithyl-N6-L-lysine dehydrogenase PylD [Deltaproteobacteria bacterium Smac51]
MTRLTSLDVENIESGWAEYDKRILRILGTDLTGLAAAAAGCETDVVRIGLKGRKLAAVSISSGDGIVGGFAESLAAIGRHMGLTALAMKSPDAEGFQEAADWGADYLIYADDDSFIVRDQEGRKMADNNPATSRVFTAALEMMCGGLRGREVIVLGLGIIGCGASARLKELGAIPLMYDIDDKRREAAAKTGDGEMISGQAELQRALERTGLIFDATPVKMALEEPWPEHLIVAAPGVPLSWPIKWMEQENPSHFPAESPGRSKAPHRTSPVRATHTNRLWHDPLQSGTAAMLAMISLL